MRRKEKKTEEKLSAAFVPEIKTEDAAFSESISDALKQKNEKGFFLAIIAVATVLTLLVVGALADILTLCFQVNRIFGYVVLAVTLTLVGVFVVRPVVKVIGERFFITDITADNCDLAVRRNYRALKNVATALVEYHENPKNIRFRYLSEQTLDALKTALAVSLALRLRKPLAALGLCA